jgi:hypothetical protein
LAPLAQAASAGADGASEALLRTLAPEVLRVVRSVLGATHPETDEVTLDSSAREVLRPWTVRPPLLFGLSAP